LIIKKYRDQPANFGPGPGHDPGKNQNFGPGTTLQFPTNEPLGPYLHQFVLEKNFWPSR
jgi:hypothetical protein